MLLPRLIILDRDGVINHDSEHYIKTPDEWIPIPESLKAIAILNHLGVKVGIASNQRGIGRGILSLDDLTHIHNKMNQMLQAHEAHIDTIRFCPALERSHPDHKPNPGMLISILNEFNINPSRETVYFIGDKISDLQAAINAKCQPILVRTGYGQHTQSNLGATFADIPIFDNLLQFVHQLTQNEAKK